MDDVVFLICRIVSLALNYELGLFAKMFLVYDHYDDLLDDT